MDKNNKESVIEKNDINKQKNKDVVTTDNLTEQQRKSIRKFVGHYLELFPITGSQPKPNELRFLEESLSGKDLLFESMSGRVITIVYKNDSVKYCFLHLLKKLPFLSSARYISLYDILDVQFGKHQKYSSIRDINAPIILVYVENITNRLKDEYLLRAVDYWCKKGSTVWIYFKGMSVEWTSHFEKTKNFAMSNRYMSIDMNNCKRSSKKEMKQSLEEENN